MVIRGVLLTIYVLKKIIGTFIQFMVFNVLFIFNYEGFAVISQTLSVFFIFNQFKFRIQFRPKFFFFNKYKTGTFKLI